MSQIFVPGLIREENYVVRKTRRLPIKGKVLVKEGKEVGFDQKIAEAVVKGPEVVVDAYEELHILSPIFDNYTFKKEFLLKGVGDRLTQDEIIARRKAWGLFTATCLSPINGILEKMGNCAFAHTISLYASEPFTIELFSKHTERICA